MEFDHAEFLGITFDSRLTFVLNADEVREKCFKRLNIIKILSNKSWNLSRKVLLNVYKSLIRSVIDYSFSTINSMSEANLKRIQVIQNKAVRVIFKKYEATNEEIENLATKLGLMSISNRLCELNEN